MPDEEPRMTPCSLVSVVDDDESVRESLPDLLTEFGFTARCFSSAEEFLASGPRETDCLVLDIRMPGLSGFELHLKLREMNLNVPVIFVTGQADDESRASAPPGRRGIAWQAF